MRQKRKLKDGAVYKCTGTINRYQNELLDEIAKTIFLDLLNDCKLLFDYELYDFSIQNNRVILVIKPLGKQELWKIMQYLLGVFGMRFNKQFGFHGHVWYDRFKSEIIASPDEVEKIQKELNEFPIENKLAEKVRDYIFGGLYYLDRKKYSIVSIFTEERFYFELVT